MRRTEKREYAAQVGVQCDRCGGEMSATGGGPLGLSATAFGEFESPLLADGLAYEFDACEACLTGWWATFRRVPVGVRL